MGIFQPTYAEEAAEFKVAEEETKKTIPDEIHRIMRSGVRRFADRIDRFFVDERIEAERQRSSLRLRPTLEWREGGELDFSFRFKANLVLPRLKRKFQMFALSLVDEENDDVDPDLLDTTPNTLNKQNVENRSSALGLEYNLFSQLRRHVRFRVGAKFHDLEVNPFTSARYRHTFVFEHWLSIIKQRVYWFGDTGFGEQSDLEWEGKIGEKVQFRSISSVIWSETSKGVDLAQTLMLRRFTDADKAISLSYQIKGHTRPNSVVDAHVIAILYRQQFWREWLFFDVSPQVHYLREADYSSGTMLFFSFETII